MLDVAQHSPEWHAARLGKVTASRVHDIVAKTKTGYSASRANYLAELVAERLTGTSAERFTSAAMAWGTEHEADARSAYAFLFASPVQEVGFVPHPVIRDTGASPDGLVGADGLVEIKAPNTATHIETLLGASVPIKYADQMQWQMACTGRQWCDFVSFDPRMLGAMQLHVTRINRDGARISELETEVCRFLEEVDAKVSALRERYETKEAA
jgi:putative phage-type endonuclease